MGKLESPLEGCIFVTFYVEEANSGIEEAGPKAMAYERVGRGDVVDVLTTRPHGRHIVLWMTI